jgi:hypothetical protein
VDFPSLQQLTLRRVTMTGDSFRAVLAGCPALESLLLEKNVGVGCLRISSPTLKSIGFLARWEKPQGDNSTVNVNELVVEDAPCLERLLPLDPDNGSTIIRVISAPKLEVLGSLGMVQLHLGTTVFQVRSRTRGLNNFKFYAHHIHMLSIVLNMFHIIFL